MSSTSPTAISCSNLVKRFSDGPRHVTAIDHVSFAVPTGHVVVITGPSGSGKTTLLELLGGMQPPDEGTIAIGEAPIDGTSAHERALLRRREIGYVFQTGNLLPMLSVYENVTVALDMAGLSAAEAHQRAVDALSTVGLAEVVHQRPHTLSAGQRQRAAVARALAKRPRVMLLDEPTANLDSESAHATFALIASLCRTHHRTAILATHDAHAVGYADEHYRLIDGVLSVSEES